MKPYLAYIQSEIDIATRSHNNALVAEIEKIRKQLDINIPDTSHRDIGFNQALEQVISLINSYEHK